jgi:hypothetical protein
MRDPRRFDTSKLTFVAHFAVLKRKEDESSDVKMTALLRVLFAILSRIFFVVALDERRGSMTFGKLDGGKQPWIHGIARLWENHRSTAAVGGA